MRVTIIGAGLIGLATALELHATGHEVTLVDESPASGATYHAGGMLAPAAEVVYGQEPLYPLMIAAARLYPDLLGRLPADARTGFDATGTLLVAGDRADGTHLRELAAHQQTHGMDVEVITTRQARQLEPALSPQISGAVHIPGDVQVVPRIFAQTILQHLGEGAIVRERACEIDGTQVITASGRRVDGDHVIVACGVAAADLLAPHGVTLDLRPVYGDILRVRTPNNTPIVRKVVRGFVEDRPVYVIPRPIDGTIAIGATSREDGRPAPQVEGVHQLLRDAIRLVPGLEECDFLEATAGTRPGTPDDLPYFGKISDQITVSTGFFRHGILLSSLAARATRALLEGEDLQHATGVDFSACDPWRSTHFPHERKDEQ
ncbi:glycine oxidase ThiO [Corynebacterium sp. zg254]|uniref:glycine oxidase n=1 Tax=Corynebacterium zhongnanshanii TaxID=2768834 RepID=A0ABQ6VFR4_9CORY|nr:MULTISPECIES: glycine oxidase ThiO [Corynebacterium]KAB3523148.1 glycine oxidase ThiO [Corynebacterium zhongnanshanii]MCR5913746.1 glycine oxidase ThiO [Corynebacterium sp. zg254]